MTGGFISRSGPEYDHLGHTLTHETLNALLAVRHYERTSVGRMRTLTLMEEFGEYLLVHGLVHRSDEGKTRRYFVSPLGKAWLREYEQEPDPRRRGNALFRPKRRIDL